MDVKYLGLTASDYFEAPAPSGERLQVFELYSGVASIHKAAVRVGKTSTTFDKEADKRQDVLTKEGFQMALNSVLRIENDGLLFSPAPPNAAASSLHVRQTTRGQKPTTSWVTWIGSSFGMATTSQRQQLSCFWSHTCAESDACWRTLRPPGSGGSLL